MHHPISAPSTASTSTENGDSRRCGTRSILPLLPLVLVACGDMIPGGDAREADSLRSARAPVHVDSTFPAEEEIHRFRQGLSDPEGLKGGLESRRDLVDALILRLEAADTAGLAELALDRSEFAWFYYPHTMYVEGPYKLPPGLVWFQLQNRSSRGLAALLGSYAGESLFYAGHRCPDEGEVLGRGRIWHGCTVLGELPSGEEVEDRLFGSILAVDGRYKLVSFSNGL